MATPMYLSVVTWLTLFILPLVFGNLMEDEFEGSRTLTLEHSFTTAGHEAFSKRGTIVIQSLKGNKAHFTENAAFSRADRDSLRAAVNKAGLYRVRILAKNNVEGEETYVSSATTACNILESHLNDVITVSFDQSGEVLGVSIHGNIRACSGIDVPSSNLTHWRTSIDVTTTTSGPSPDTQTYLEKVRREEQEKSKNQNGDNRSFLGKYWMYIVPVVIMMFIMSSAADQQGGAGGGGGGR